jgi:hypothetical protein
LWKTFSARIDLGLRDLFHRLLGLNFDQRTGPRFENRGRRWHAEPRDLSHL